MLSQNRREMDFSQIDLTIQQIPNNNRNNSSLASNKNMNYPSPVSTPTSQLPTTIMPSSSSPTNSSNQLSKYGQLLLIIEEMGKDIRPTYSGSRSSAERLKRTIVHARILVRECLLETERQQSSGRV